MSQLIHFVSVLVNAAALGAAAFESYLFTRFIPGFILHLLLTTWKDALQQAFSHCKVSCTQDNWSTYINAIYSSATIFVLISFSFSLSFFAAVWPPRKASSHSTHMCQKEVTETQQNQNPVFKDLFWRNGGGGEVYLLYLTDLHSCVIQVQRCEVLTGY